MFFDLIFSSQQNNCHVLENTAFYPITFFFTYFYYLCQEKQTLHLNNFHIPLNDTVDHFKQIQTMCYIAKYAAKYTRSKARVEL